MPATYTEIGENSSASTASLVVTTTVAAAVGDLVSVLGGAQALAPTYTCADSAGNAWTKDIQEDHSATAISCVAYRTTVTVTMPIGTTVTLGHNKSAGKMGANVVKIPSPTASPLDATPTKSAESASVGSAASTGTTASPSTTSWIGRTAAYGAFPGVTFTPQASWTEDFDAQGFEAQSIVGTSTTAMRGAATLSSAADDWVILVAVYKVATSTTFPQAVAATSSTSTAMLRSPAHSVAATATNAVALTKRPNKLLAAVVPGYDYFVDTFLLHGFSVTLAATVSNAVALTKRATHIVAVSASSSAASRRAVSHTVAATASTSAAASKSATRSLAATAASAVVALAGKVSTGPIALYRLATRGGTPTLRTTGGTPQITTTGGTPTIETKGPTG